MTEARYRGQKVVAVAPDYADNVKFADEWLPARPGTDAALAMAMGHVVLKEFFVDRQTPYFTDYVKKYTDLPLPGAPGRGLERGRATVRTVYRAGKFLTAADLPGARARGERRVQDRADRRAHRRAGGPERLPRAPVRRDRGRPVEPRPRRRRPAAVAARHLGDTCRRPAAALRHRRRRRRSTCRGASRCAGSVATSSRPCSTCCSRSTASGGDGLPGEWPASLRRRVRAVHPGLAGGDHRRARHRPPPASAASSRRTPRSPTAAR